jgi:FMN phosphatase YigB (HAD superfamily)
MHTPPRAIVFDLGKVLVDFDYQIAIRHILPQCRSSAADISRLLLQENLLFDYETGRLTTPAFLDRFCAATGYAGTQAEFAGFFADIFTPIPIMLDWHARLRARGHRTFIFSNTNELAVGHIRRQFPFFSNFDNHILSYEHGCMKPEERLYTVVEQCTGERGADILYLDDRPENIETGRRLGWQAIQHDHPEATIRLLAGLLT